MKTKKRIAAVVIALAVVLVGAKLASLGCTRLQAWFPDLAYDGRFVWGLPPILIFFLYSPVYDLISFLTWKLGYEESFDEANIYYEIGTGPDPMRQKLFFAYPFLLVIIAAFVAGWTKVVYCD
jgi:hypothetical protein